MHRRLRGALCNVTSSRLARVRCSMSVECRYGCSNDQRLAERAATFATDNALAAACEPPPVLGLLRRALWIFSILASELGAHNDAAAFTDSGAAWLRAAPDQSRSSSWKASVHSPRSVLMAGRLLHSRDWHLPAYRACVRVLLLAHRTSVAAEVKQGQPDRAIAPVHVDWHRAGR